MGFLIIFIALVVVFILGAGYGKGKPDFDEDTTKPDSQTGPRAEGKEKILKFMLGKEQVTNNDVEKLLGVSDSTATRYLDELEEEGKINQVGTTGQGVFYTLK